MNVKNQGSGFCFWKGVGNQRECGSEMKWNIQHHIRSQIDFRSYRPCHEEKRSLFFKKTGQLLSLSFCHLFIFNGLANCNVLRLALGLLLFHLEALWKVAPVGCFDVLEFSLFFCYVFSTFHSPICPLAQLPLSSTSWVSSILASFETQLQKTAAVGNVCVCRHHVFNFFRTCVTVSSIFVISNIFHDTLPPFFFGDSWLLTDSWCHASNMGVFSKRCVATSTFSRSWVACIFFCCFCLIILHAVNLCFKRLGLS